MIICPECHRKNEDNRKYCSLCGTDLTETKREAAKHKKIDFNDRSLSTKFRMFLFYKKGDYGYEIAKTKLATYFVFILMLIFYLIKMYEIDFYIGIITCFLFAIITYVIGLLCRRFLDSTK
ncbi:MAG: zinc-ribbon domain-containing protein [archaeon]|nr:zinc-ribbon domain-containing protein [archaeon]